jgi:PAS domain S-box-containing protein
LKDPTIKRVLALFALVTVVLVAVAVHAVRQINRTVTASDWVNRTHALINELEGIAAATQSAEGSLRVYALTRDPRDLAAVRRSQVRLADHLEVAGALARDQPATAGQVARLATLAGNRTAFARELGAAPPESLAALFAADAAGTAVEELLRLVERLVTEQMDLLAARDQESFLQAQTTRWTIGLGVAINFLLLAAGAWLIRDDILMRRRAAAAMAEANAQLESRVQARTAELSAANDRLSMENLERRWANQALEHQLRYNHLIINSITDLVFVVTKVANISRINPAVEHDTGWLAKDLINRPLPELVRLTAGDLPLQRALKEGHDLRDLPATLRRSEGGEVPVRLTFYPLRDGNNVVGGVVILNRTTA